MKVQKSKKELIRIEVKHIVPNEKIKSRSFSIYDSEFEMTYHFLHWCASTPEVFQAYKNVVSKK
jgi:hypothetical protein